MEGKQEGPLGLELVLEGGLEFPPAGLLPIEEQDVATQQPSVALAACQCSKPVFTS